MSGTIQITVKAEEAVRDWMSKNSFVMVNKSLLRKIGDRSTILLAETISQYERWAPNKLEEDGSFYWTQESCEIETSYSRSTQRRGFQDLEDRKLLKCENRRIIDNKGAEKNVRFIKIDFQAIAQLMFEDDTPIIEEIKNKYENKKKQNKESRQRVKEKDSVSKVVEEKEIKKEPEKIETKNAPSLDVPVGIQNESLQGFKMNPCEDSKWEVSNKESLIKNNKSLKNNLSIYTEEVEKTDLPTTVKECIKDLRERLIANNISIIDLTDIYNAYKDRLNPYEFTSEFRSAILDPKNEVIYKIKRLMDTYLTNYLKNKAPNTPAPTKQGRKEMIPDFLTRLQEQEALQADQPQKEEEAPQIDDDFEAEKARLKAELLGLDSELKQQRKEREEKERQQRNALMNA